MGSVFLYGALRHMPLLEVVLGRKVTAAAADLPGYAVNGTVGGSYPMIRVQAGGQVPGLLVSGLSRKDMARLDFYELPFGYRLQPVTVDMQGQEVATRVYVSDLSESSGVDWVLADWQNSWGAVVTLAAIEYMAGFETPQAEAMARRYPMILVRAASRMRAGKAAPTALRHRMQAGDLQLVAQNRPYAHFFAVEEYDLRHRRFDGKMTEVVNRATFVSGDAATVVPYDPVRDRVMIVEQFRPGPFARGDSQPWQLEPIAGRIDPGETPDEAARREAVEEAGLVLGALLHVANYYPSPGAKTEFLYSFVAIADLPDSAGGIFGLAEEGEDIRAHVIGFDALMALVASGEVATAPLIMTALWLQPRRAALRRDALEAAGRR